MHRPLRPKPVVFACRGCELDFVARRLAAELDRRGLAEASVIGADAAKARARFPIYALDGCERACAARWLGSLGVTPERSFVLDPAKEAAAEIERVAAALR